jgi:hypothetical protein
MLRFWLTFFPNVSIYCLFLFPYIFRIESADLTAVGLIFKRPIIYIIVMGLMPGLFTSALTKKRLRDFDIRYALITLLALVTVLISELFFIEW